jgi:hypothetical protein
MGTSNEEGLEQVVLQSEQVLAELKAMDGHAGQPKCLQKVAKCDRWYIMSPNYFSHL